LRSTFSGPRAVVTAVVAAAAAAALALAALRT
jgi:hypothetical protein